MSLSRRGEPPARKARTKCAAMSVPREGRPPHWELRKAACSTTKRRGRKKRWWCLHTSQLSRIDRYRALAAVSPHCL